MTVHQFPLRAVRPCDVEDGHLCQNAQDWPNVQTTPRIPPRIYTPTMPSATHLVRAVYWAQLFATALLAIAACLAVGAACGALAIWMNTP